ncbi:AAC(3) family N-acetyltransferase [Nocardia sp. CDC159]|uniref:Aminoglycoside N(3)-acetyltransferase n=1 Tax=Nocardia pulmonis TaxID=2951408 RepID=A0A9X2E9D3_9NOCA|nr:MULTISPECIES: AAC(3) family N-acetyltransferase [Nocardia]MCM6774211.1 AAC(3) family N-acetyltransferase [Nocardia pulmonis]MCM6787098.1 AAC(3) family N-acetyltransferase [Nocardia sp. CDC159]
MISRDELERQLRTLGVAAGAVLIVHISFRAVGPVEGGPHGLIDALRAVLGERGTLVMPSMTGGGTQPYDPARTPTDGMGIVAETFWRLPGVLRGDHPTSTFAAAGRHASKLTAPQPLSPPHGLDSPVGRAYELNGSVLLLGVGHSENTTMHLAEDLAEVPYRSTDTATTADGRTVTIEEPNHCCRGFVIADHWLRQRNAQREGTIGTAHARLFAARDLIDTVVPRLRADPLMLLCAPNTGCGECDEAHASAHTRLTPPTR